jgi:tetratricopeptide (TPR) repeat protein
VEWALRDEAARPLLARVYAHDAHYRSLEARWDESGALARQALSLAGGRTGEQQAVTLWAVISQAASLARSGERPAPRHAVRLLRTWLPQDGSLPEHASWMLANMAGYTLMSGDVEEALELGEQACRVAQRCCHPDEAYRRRGDYANLLLKAGRPAEALRALPEPVPNGDAPQDEVEILLLLERAHRQAGNRAEAHDWQQKALGLINTHHLERLRPQADALAATL